VSSSFRGLRHAAVLAAVVGVAGCVITAGGGLANEGGAGASMEMEMDRPGADYQTFDLHEPRPTDCRSACAGDVRCMAYTYVRPGVAGSAARCHLKSSIPNAIENGCCISGVKGMAASPPGR
jgi:hypothetical protein